MDINKRRLVLDRSLRKYQAKTDFIEIKKATAILIAVAFLNIYIYDARLN